MRDKYSLKVPTVIIPLKENTFNMLPSKHSHNSIQHYRDATQDTFANRPPEQSCVDQASFNELCRKVDAMADDMHVMKQMIFALDPRRVHERQQHSYQPSLSSRDYPAISRSHNQIPVKSPREHRQTSPYDETHESSIKSELFRPEVIVSSEVFVNRNAPSFLRRASMATEFYEAKLNNDVLMTSATMVNRNYASQFNNITDMRRSKSSPISPETNSMIGEIKPDPENTKTDYLSINNLFFMSVNMSIAEIILLWEKGKKNIPPISKWSPFLKSKYREHLKEWFKVYHLFCTMCRSDIGRFISRFSDNAGQMLSVQQVASLCPDVKDNYEIFLRVSESTVIEYHPPSSTDSQQEKLFILPRKINGRKVSAKDVIQLWEYGLGEIPPIKTWNKTQKFKQQSKISRWKKIVDIFKYQCNNDMKKFESIYTDDHGCLLPVAAITSKFETVYGDELNITSKLMTVSTDVTKTNMTAVRDSFSPCYNPQKRNYNSTFDDEEEDMTSSKQLRHSEYSSTDDDDESSNGHTSPIKKRLHEFNHSNHVHSVANKVIKKEGVETFPFAESFSNEEPCSMQFSNRSSPSDSESDENILNVNPQQEDLIKEDMTIEQCIEYWERGCDRFPPISQWDEKQKSKQSTLIKKIGSIFYIYQELFKRDLTIFLQSCKNGDENLLNIDEVLHKFESHVLKLRDQNTSLYDGNLINKASSMTFDFSHHRTISQCPAVLHLLPRKINGRKVNAKDVLHLWYYGLNKIPPIKDWSPQHKAVQQSKISRWKKIVDLFEQEYDKDWEKFEKIFSNSLGQLLPITAIIAKHEEAYRSYEVSTMKNSFN